MEKIASTSDIILDTALELAEETSWENVRLYHVAQRAGLTLNHIRRYFREKEELVDAWLDRADRAMLDETNCPHFLALSPRERLNQLFMAWLEALSPHRPVMRQMVFNRLEPGHLHMQVASLLRISRTVQWAREAAQREQTFLFRAFDETALTSTYLAAFLCWLNDSTQNYQRTRRLLDRILYLGEVIESLKPSFLRPYQPEENFTPAPPQEAR
ncbi:TetR family transcriptional regulator [Nitrosococcus oceani]|uniref:Transcriptional regulator, TetR family n=2 Tax=Nitrosococcus oceani TaxID=1229 RepID=Q3J7C9_NITOC|nr:TetR family transcriptional regulator [Nitrosococcus oceani]KFI18295.1 TetR family transcriptional regulator [Nitrosococcus oceani C-27]ABA59267.1 transcriptional regulator, TetR family [Nitrosococcus oceani ATCC 19707]EDZ66261.1 transcriptional regulator, TetR family protein [Nitrosococcus oceani AFC27]KFI21473.1 TetR family transcriptional regulator [Nitrosococcus oceani]GEM21092.1 TetR family transcriptional regulator [Nitrosococcus oceani]